MHAAGTAVLAAVGLAAVGLAAVAAPLASAQDSAVHGVVVPALSPLARQGQPLFGIHCSGCHGESGSGGGKGPPLIVPLYASSRLPDAAIVTAIRQRAPRRYRSFGDMPPVTGLSAADIRAIVAYIHEVQRANGIE